MCAVPKFPTTDVVRGVPSLSKRYRELYIPSDFSKCASFSMCLDPIQALSCW